MGLRLFLLLLGVLAGGLSVAALVMGDKVMGIFGLFGSVVIIGKVTYEFRRVR